MKALQTMLAIAVLASVSSLSYAGRCDGNNGNGKGNICEPAANPGTPTTGETDRQYIERVHGYTHGNSIAINHLDKRQEVTEAATAANREYIERVHSYAHGNSLGIQSLDKRTDALEAGKVDRSEFAADQARQDKATAAAVAQNERTAQIVSGHTGSIRELEGRATQADLGIAENRAANVRQDKTLATHGSRLDDHDARMNAQDVRNDSQDTHINNVQNAAQIANEKADSGAVRMDGIEGSVRETNTQLAITDGRSINNAVRLDGVEGHNVRQDASIDALNDQAQVINNTINNHGDTLSSHQQQIDQMGSRMSNEIAGAMNRANEAHKEAKTAQDQAAAALSVAGMQFDLNYNGFQTAISAASFGGSTALSVGAGGKISERVFVNAAVTNAGSATGGVVSSTFRW